MGRDETPDANYFLCLHTTAGIRARAVLCKFHTQDPDVEVVARNGDKIFIRRPECVMCYVERGLQRELSRERGAEVTTEEVRRFMAAARRVDIGRER